MNKFTIELTSFLEMEFDIGFDPFQIEHIVNLALASSASRLTPVAADAGSCAECPTCGQPTGWIDAPRR